MKSLVVVLAALFSLNVQAAEKISMEYEKESPYTLEPSVTFSSIARGSQFLGLAMTARVESWLRIGAEAELPMNYEKPEQIYTGRLFVRIPFLDGINKVYLQNSISVSQWTSNGVIYNYGSSTFFNSSILLGFTRKVTADWSLGATAGAQYSTIDSYVFNETNNPSALFTRASLVGSFIF